MRYTGSDGSAILMPHEIALLDELVAELEDRYDGAPDSKTLWMGMYIAGLNHILGPTRQESKKA